MKLNTVIEEKMEALRKLCRQYDIQSMYIFGSAAIGNLTQKSDIDILITFKNISIEQYTNNFFALHETLEELFSRKVDLITDRSLTNPYFIESVEKTKRLVYAA